MQEINNIVQSEQLKHNGRIPESNRSIRSLYNSNRAGYFCLKVLPMTMVGLLLSGCFGPTLTTLGPLQIKQSDLITTPLKLAKYKENNYGK